LIKLARSTLKSRISDHDRVEPHDGDVPRSCRARTAIELFVRR
jgi:hypothetical protein